MSANKKKNLVEVHLEPPLAFPQSMMDTKTLEAEGYIPITLRNIQFDTTAAITGPCIVKAWVLCTALRLLDLDECRNLCNFLYPLRIRVSPNVTVDGIRAAIIGFVFGESENIVKFLSLAVFSKDKPDFAALAHLLQAPYFNIDWSLLPEPTLQEMDGSWTMNRMGRSTILIESRSNTSDYAKHGYELRIAFDELEKSMRIPEGFNEKTIVSPPSSYRNLMKEAEEIGASPEGSPPRPDNAISPKTPGDSYRPVYPGGQSTPVQQRKPVPSHLVPFMEAHDTLGYVCDQYDMNYLSTDFLMQFLHTMALPYNEDYYIPKRFIQQEPEQLATAINDHLISVIQGTGFVTTKSVSSDVINMREIAEELRTLRVIPRDINEKLSFIETSTKNILSYLKSGDQRIQPATLPTVMPVEKPIREEVVEEKRTYTYQENIPLPQIDLG